MTIMKLKIKLVVEIFSMSILLNGICNSAYADFAEAMTNYSDKNYGEAMTEFKRSAVLGHKQSQFNIGVMYYRGEGVDKDLIEAYAWLALSATDKDPERVRIRDLVMSKMEEAQKDKAIDRMASLSSELAAEAKTLEPVLLSQEECTYRLKRIKTELPSYPHFLKAEGAQNIADLDFNIDKYGAVRDYSIVYASNRAFDSYIFKALPKWRYTPLTSNGRPVEVVSTRLRMTFQLGDSVVDPKKTKKYADELRKEAESREPSKVFGAAYVAELVHELNIDKRDTNRWFYKAAQAGLTSAEYQIGKSLFLGDGCVQDTRKGLRWLTMAAEEKSPDSQYFLGISMLGSDKVAEDRPKAIEWLNKAANAHHEKAMMRLAWILATDKDDKVRDPARALSLVNEVYKNYGDKLRSFEVLAAAQAANGKYDDAVNSQKSALKEAKSIEYPLDDVQARLNTYQNKQPWLE